MVTRKPILSALTCAIFLFGCQDTAGQQDGNGGKNEQTNNDQASYGNSTSKNQGSATNVTSNNTSPTNTSTSNSTTQGNQGDPEQDSRTQDGEWSDVERVTIIPREHNDDHNEPGNEYFCTTSQSANAILIGRVIEIGRGYTKCFEPRSPYNSGYLEYRFERLKHLGGIRLPLEFDLINFSGRGGFDVGKTYLVGFRELDGKIFGHGGGFEVVLYDEKQESDRVIFSGKMSSLESTTQAHILDRDKHCNSFNHIPITDDDAYRLNWIQKREEQCVNN